MARARNSLIDLPLTPCHHVISRCVRRASLCGDDRYSGKNFAHRHYRGCEMHHNNLRASE